MNPQTKCCANCVHATWGYRELGSVDRSVPGKCSILGDRFTIVARDGVGCPAFENQSNPVTEESKRMKEAALIAKSLSGEIWVRFVNATEAQHQSGLAGDWKHQSSVLEWAAEILELEAK